MRSGEWNSWAHLASTDKNHGHTLQCHLLNTSVKISCLKCLMSRLGAHDANWPLTVERTPSWSERSLGWNKLYFFFFSISVPRLLLGGWVKLRDKPSALRSCLSHFWDKTLDGIVMCLKQKLKYMCDFFFSLGMFTHIHT